MKNKSRTLVVFHKNCPDGFGAAWVVRRALGEENVDFYGAVYQQPPPDVANRDVVLVDFSYKRPVMDEMAKSAKSILILDHHESAERDLKDFGSTVDSSAVTNVVFDMNRSGAGIAWDYYNPDTERPRFINYIEDHDLWRKQLSHSDEFSVALRSYPCDFEVWDGLFRHSLDFETTAADTSYLISEGTAILRFWRKQIEKVKAEAFDVTFFLPPTRSIKARAANCPYVFASEVAGEIIGDAECGVCFFQKANGYWQYSLRSAGDYNVAEIAEYYGGGGHRNAAGFTTSHPVHVRPR